VDRGLALETGIKIAELSSRPSRACPACSSDRKQRCTPSCVSRSQGMPWNMEVGDPPRCYRIWLEIGWPTRQPFLPCGTRSPIGRRQQRHDLAAVAPADGEIRVGGERVGAIGRSPLRHPDQTGVGQGHRQSPIPPHQAFDRLRCECEWDAEHSALVKRDHVAGIFPSSEGWMTTAMSCEVGPP
jgi:hypothetical protein